MVCDSKASGVGSKAKWYHCSPVRGKRVEVGECVETELPYKHPTFAWRLPWWLSVDAVGMPPVVTQNDIK
jgi:hypothetical protein